MSANPQPEVMEVNLTWQGSIAILTINNVARRNAWSVPVKEDMLRHMKALSSDNKCRGIVVTGAGGVFCAGGDVKNMKNRQANNVGFQDRRLQMGEVSFDALRLMVHGPKPVVMAVEGPAYGAGLSIAMGGDYTVAANNAKFCGAQILRGLCPDIGLYYLLTARTNPGRARELLLSGRMFSAADALEYGVVHELTEPGKALDAAIAQAERFAAVPPLAFALTKSAMTHSYHTLEACFRAEQDYQPVVGLSKDHKESVAAFLEKRKPVYTGE
jgi:enoyl-CoA hydratase/carnithine racemase